MFGISAIWGVWRVSEGWNLRHLGRLESVRRLNSPPYGAFESFQQSALAVRVDASDRPMLCVCGPDVVCVSVADCCLV